MSRRVAITQIQRFGTLNKAYIRFLGGPCVRACGIHHTGFTTIRPTRCRANACKNRVSVIGTKVHSEKDWDIFELILRPLQSQRSLSTHPRRQILDQKRAHKGEFGPKKIKTITSDVTCTNGRRPEISKTMSFRFPSLSQSLGQMADHQRVGDRHAEFSTATPSCCDSRHRFTPVQLLAHAEFVACFTRPDP
ncbi:hypothetical protein BDM02DRAFT_2063512 [Thelephora ganbajun]|uniref:Uncharacterized protein n=1 Tax=Thelephora ganbajun TaxID=370292 RepID=A0ACB6YZL6_THEGA|nr:hypothetical protein BDM02DRAFT_2063512 [Thelephora ganbajun]